jgi:hypothetical protein
VNSALELTMRGWTRTRAPAEVLHAVLGGARRVEALEIVQLTGWCTPRAADLRVPVVDPDAKLSLTCRGPVRVHVIEGSQGLQLPADPHSHATTADLQPGECLLADPRLWIRISDPHRVAGTLIAGGREQPPERLDAGPDFGLYSRGFTILRGALSEGRVQALRAALDRALDQDVAAWGVDELKRIGQFGAIRNLSDVDPVFVELLADSPAYPVIERVMRPGFVLHSFDGLVLEPAEGRFPWDFHTDVDALVGLAAVRARVPAVNVLYYLDRVTAENGATWIVPGSHLSSWAGVGGDNAAQFALQAVGEPGDVLIFDARVSHCAGNNGTSGSRRLIKTLFCEPWMQPQMDYRRALGHGKWENLPERVRNVLGEGRTPPASAAEFRERMAARVQ